MSYQTETGICDTTIVEVLLCRSSIISIKVSRLWLHGLHRQHRFIALVQHLDEARTMPRSGLERDARASCMVTRTRKRIAGAHRVWPAQFVDAGRSEAARRQVVIDQQPHRQRNGLPAAGDHLAERTLRCPLRIDMHLLWIVLAGEVDDRLLGNCHGAEFEHRARRG